MLSVPAFCECVPIFHSGGGRGSVGHCPPIILKGGGLPPNNFTSFQNFIYMYLYKTFFGSIISGYSGTWVELFQYP